jgi:cell division septum initiation protein DivIVA
MSDHTLEPGASFKTRLLGYDKEEVRACLVNLVSDCEEAWNEVERLKAKLAGSEGPPPRATYDNVGGQVEKVLVSAHKVADEVKSDARKTAKEILSDAQEESARLRSQAEADASALTSTATARLAELNLEIDALMKRREAVHALMARAADQLDQLSRNLRASVNSSDRKAASGAGGLGEFAQEEQPALQK